MVRDQVNRELTPEVFAYFLEWLNPDRDIAAEEYERLRFRLITFFSHRNCRFPDELADETINRVALKIKEIEIENKMGFCYGVAKNIFLESLRKEKEFINIEDIQIALPEKKEEEFNDRCLNKCLASLEPENRSLILDYFSESKSAKISLREKLSAGLSISQTALRMKIVRLKQRLKLCLEGCNA